MTAMVSHDHCLEGGCSCELSWIGETGKKFLKIAFSTNVAKEKF